MRTDRRRFAALLAAAALAPAALRPAAAGAAALHTVTDMAGRKVTVPRDLQRIVLLDPRDILSMALLHTDPSALVAGWAGPELLDSDAVRRQYDRQPDGGAIPVVGGQTGDTVSVEHILGLAPDLVVATAHAVPDLAGGMLARRLQAAGIPLLFSSTFSNRSSGGDAGDPMHGTAALMRMWAALLNRPREAEAFLSFVDARLAATRDRLAGTVPCKTYLELQSTYGDCCWAAGNAIWGALLRLAGGRNLTAVDAPWYAKVAVEQLVAEAPDVYIATGGAFAHGMRPAIGPGLDPAEGREGLRRLCGRAGFASLPAVRNGRVHGIWTGLVAVRPLNFLFVELAAQWLHPAAFADGEPGQSLQEINRRFLARPLPGPCWLSLDPGPGRSVHP